MNKQIKNLIIAMTLSILCAPIASLCTMNGEEENKEYEEKHSASETNETSNTYAQTDAQTLSNILYEAMKSNDVNRMRIIIESVENNEQKLKQIIETLLSHGLPVDVPLDTQGSTALIFAAQKGYIDIVNLLLAHHADITKQNALGETALHKAALLGRLTIVQRLLEFDQCKLTLEQRDSVGWTALMNAVIRNHTEVTKLLLDHHANAYTQSNHKSTTFKSAVENKNYTILNLLLNAHSPIEDNVDIALMQDALASGLNLAASMGDNHAISLLLQKINDLRKEESYSDDNILMLQRDKIGTDTLIEAIKSGHQDIALSLLQTVHKNVYTYSEDNDTTPQGAFTLSEQDAIRIQHEAARYPGTERIIDLLQTHAISIIDARDANGRTALMIAAEHGHASVVNFLIKLNEKHALSLVDNKGNTPLILASRAGKAENVAVLLHHMLRCEDKNEIINHFNHDETSALVDAINNKHEQVAMLLLKPATLADEVAYNQYRLNLEDGKTALCAAAQKGLLFPIKTLVAHGVPVDAVVTMDAAQYTPLPQACVSSQHDAVKLLIKLKADVNKQPEGSNGPLTNAVCINNGPITKTLLDARADASKQDETGFTMLHIAISLGAQDALKELLGTEALEISDNEGLTPLQFALFALFAADDVDRTAMVKSLIAAGANPHLPNSKSKFTPWQSATPELQQLMEDARREREASLFNARTLAQQSVVPSQIAQHIFEFARGVPAQKITKLLRAAHPIANDYEAKEDDEEVKTAAETQSCKNTDCAKRLTIRCNTCTSMNPETNMQCKMCSLALHTSPQSVVVNSTDDTVFENNAHMNHDGELALDWSN